MEIKKNKKVDIERWRSTLLMLGLVIALAVVYVGFEWQTSPSKVNDLGQVQTTEIEEEIIPITREQEIKPPPPPPPPKVVEVLNIVDDDVEIEE